MPPGRAVMFKSTRVEVLDPAHWKVMGAAMDTGAAYLGERVQISLTILTARQD